MFLDSYTCIGFQDSPDSHTSVGIRVFFGSYIKSGFHFLLDSQFFNGLRNIFGSHHQVGFQLLIGSHPINGLHYIAGSHLYFGFHILLGYFFLLQEILPTIIGCMAQFGNGVGLGNRQSFDLAPGTPDVLEEYLDYCSSCHIVNVARFHTRFLHSFSLFTLTLMLLAASTFCLVEGYFIVIKPSIGFANLYEGLPNLPS